MVKRFFLRAFCGMFLGFSIFAPGISGSVVAIAMGVYQDIIRIASSPFKGFKKNVLFLLPIVVGAGLSAVGFVLGFNRLIDNHQRAIYMLFIGLVAGNLPLIWGEIKRYAFKTKYFFAGIITFAAAIAIVMFSVGGDGMQGTYAALWLFGLGGLVSGMAALIPGMSVATILVVVGIYEPLIYSAENFYASGSYFLSFGLFCVSCIAGLMLVSRAIKKIFDQFPGMANTAVLGFMAGSLAGMAWFSLQLDDPNFNWWIGSVMLLAGLAISGMFLLLGKRMKSTNE